LEPEHREVGEGSVFSKEEILLLGHLESNSFVELNDSGMSRYREGGKKLFDKLPVCSQFGGTVGEDIDRGLTCGVASDDPFQVRLDGLGWRDWSRDNLEIPELFPPLVIERDRVKGG
jgi:hypothetical protein